MSSLGETERLRAIALQTRLRTIEAELTLAFTWCSVAKTELDMCEFDRFRLSLQRIKDAAVSLRRRIADPAHLQPDLTPNFDAELEKLEWKIRDLELKAGY